MATGSPRLQSISIILRVFLSAGRNPTTRNVEPLMTSPEKFLQMLQADIAKWAKVVKSANVSLD